MANDDLKRWARHRHRLLEAGKIVLRAGGLSEELLVKLIGGSPEEARGIIAELVNREAISPLTKGLHRPLVHHVRELSGRLGAKGAIPGMLQGVGASNARQYTRELRGDPPPQLPPPPPAPPAPPAPPSSPPGNSEGGGRGGRKFRSLVFQAAIEALGKGNFQRADFATALVKNLALKPAQSERIVDALVQRGIIEPLAEGLYRTLVTPAGLMAKFGTRVPRGTRLKRHVHHAVPDAAPELPGRLPIFPEVVYRRPRRATPAQSAYEAELALRTPTAEKIRGLSALGRYRRLRRGGMLLRPEAVARVYGIERPSLALVLAESERREERRRQAILASRTPASEYKLRAHYGARWTASQLASAGAKLAGHAGAAGIQRRLAGFAARHSTGSFAQFAAGQAARTVAGAGAGVAGMASTIPVAGQITLAVAALTAGMIKAAQAGERFATNSLDASRGLERWSAGIARSLADLRRQDMLLERRTARATGGSASELGRAVKAMREELQPFKEGMRTIINLLGVFSARAVQSAAYLARWDPRVNDILNLLGAVNRYLDRRNKQQGDLFFNQLREMARGHAPPPKNQPPKL